MRTVRRGNALQAAGRLLVRGTAARPDARRCEGMPLSGLPSCTDRGNPEAGRKKRIVKI
jgi:hypothetical protein